MHNGDVYEASIKDIDKKSDIATIKINPQVSKQAGNTLDGFPCKKMCGDGDD